MSFEQQSQKILDLADIKINGSRPWDIQVHNPKLYSHVFSGGPLAVGETYMEGWWDVKSLDEFFYKILKVDLDKHIKKRSANLLVNMLIAKFFNLQNKKRAYQVGKKHYDLGNELYKSMLDKRMVYSCGYYKNTDNLDEAQEKKLDLICKKLGLRKGMKVLDIGCGWGSFAKYAAEKYEVEVVGVTISVEQAKYAKENCEGLPVDIRIQDYRNLNEKFDRIVSIGMFEHVGHKNYRTYMEVVKRNLKPNGLFLLHTIGSNKSVYGCDPWFDKYIFPNGMLPSIKQIGKCIEGILTLEDWHNFGSDYDKTLMDWFSNFDKNWYKIKNKYDENFYRMWKYYLLSLAGGFRARRNQVWQLVLSKKGVTGGYKSIR